MKQIALPPGFDGSSPLQVSGDEYYHLARVRRIRAGARLRGRTPEDRAFDLAVAAVRAAADEPARPWDITLFQCLPKGSKLDQIVRQAVEAGVTRIIPVESERSVVRRGDWAQRLGRLERIAREAMQQSGARALAAVGAPVALADLGAEAGRVALFLHERPPAARAAAATLERPQGFVYSPRPVGQRDAATAIPPSLHECLAGAAAGVDLLVGPEGGFSEREAARLVQAGFHPVYLGNTVLRVETAAIFALGAVKTLLLERDRWTVPRPQ